MKNLRYTKSKAHWPKPSAQMYGVTGKDVYTFILCGVGLGALFVALVWTLASALTVSERQQREMLCNSAKSSGNEIYLEKCADPNYLNLK